jgi:hypothetical protein
MPSGNVSGLFGLSSSRFATAARLGAFLASASAALLGAGCGSSSSGSSSAFTGNWELDSTTSSFTLSCPHTTGLESVPQAVLWTELVFDTGVLTPITEASGTCGPGLAFDASSTALTLSNPDPYTNQAPECDLSLGADANGNSTFLALSFSTLTFTLLSPMKGEAPKGLLAANATGQVLQQDPITGAFSATDSCTYVGAGDIFHRMTKD